MNGIDITTQDFELDFNGPVTHISMDLKNYYTKTETDGKISTAKNEVLNQVSQDYYNKTAVDNKIGDVEAKIPTIDDSLSATSENPVQNKVITNALNSLHWAHKGYYAQIQDYEWVLETDTSSSYYFEQYPYYKQYNIPTSEISGSDVYNTFVNIAFSSKDASSGKLAPFLNIFPSDDGQGNIYMMIQLYAKEPYTTEGFEIQLHYAG